MLQQILQVLSQYLKDSDHKERSLQNSGHFTNHRLMPLRRDVLRILQSYYAPFTVFFCTAASYS